MEPFPSLAFKVLIEYLLTTTKIRTDWPPAQGSRPRFCSDRAPLLIGACSCSTAGFVVCELKRQSIFGASDFGRYLFAIGLRQYLALDGIYRPIGAAFPTQPGLADSARGATGSGQDGALTLLRRPPSGDLGPGVFSPVLRTLLQTTIRTTKPSDFSSWAVPVRSPLTMESLNCPGIALRQEEQASACSSYHCPKQLS
ncbi:hypothetical protein Tco_1069642 [Tanacetum coccineum]|uniref:Uncharacterized protein n=1 Tax=Tanacetum coccineum TaxID=301880 RepID=A0ABQ5HJH9_9ASTR